MSDAKTGPAALARCTVRQLHTDPDRRAQRSVALAGAYLDLCDEHKMVIDSANYLREQLDAASAEVERLRAKILQSRWCETTGLLLHDTPQCDVCPQCNVARAALGEDEG